MQGVPGRQAGTIAKLRTGRRQGFVRLRIHRVECLFRASACVLAHQLTRPAVAELVPGECGLCATCVSGEEVAVFHGLGEARETAVRVCAPAHLWRSATGLEPMALWSRDVVSPQIFVDDALSRGRDGHPLCLLDFHLAHFHNIANARS